MQAWQAALLGAIQGLTEFLPVSSSGHLVLVQKLLHLEGDLLFFDTMLHMGTLIAVFAVMYREILALLKKPFQSLTLYLVLSTVPLVIGTLLFDDLIEEAFGGKLLGVGFLLTAVLLLSLRHLKQGKLEMAQMGVKRSVLIGLVELVAVLPGLSRSGSTIFGSRLCGIKTEDCARYSFLLSIPVILGSLVWQGKDVLENGIGAVPSVCVIIGSAIAALTGYFAMRFLLNLVKRGKLWVFGIYTGALGVAVLLDQLLLHWVF